MSEPENTPPASLTGTQLTNLALDHAMESDVRVVLLGEEVGEKEGGNILGATRGLGPKHGDHRVRTTPISEQAIVGAAIGAALGGLLPVAEIMLMNFMSVAMDQIVNHAAKLRYMSGGQVSVPLTIRTMTGAGRGSGGQHADMLEAWFAHAPGIKVVVPSSASDWYGLLLSCIFDPDPCIFIENTILMRTRLGPAPPRGFRVPIGKASVVRQGSDVTVIGYGRPMADIARAAELMEKEGVSVEVIDLRSIAPLDMETVLTSVDKTRRAVIVHEAVRSFGVGAEISSTITERLFHRLRAPVHRLGGKATPVPFSKPLETAFLWSVDGITDAIRQCFAYSTHSIEGASRER